MKNKDEKRSMRRTLKKGLNISLCAVLAGGLAAGSYHTVNEIAGWNHGLEVHAATSDDVKVSLSLADSEAEKVVGGLDVSDIVNAAMPSVVSITTKSIQEVQNYYNYYGFYGYYGNDTTEQEVEGSGSGIIIGKNDDMLLMVTNYHVIEGANTVSVTFIDGTVCEAEVRGTDSSRDLAIVGVKLADIDDETIDQIAIIAIGSSDDLSVGEQVVAIGNALGYGQSVTTGIVSAKNRKLDGSTDTISGDEIDNKRVVNLIQTDAAINPGNSGGALLNMNGELVGINSAKMASTSVEGMGYAIAISDVADVLENLMNEEPRELVDNHGVLGIVGSTVSEEARQIYGIPEGVFVSEVTEDGPSAEAGIKKNMVITTFDGKFISTIDELVALLKYYEPGEEIDVVVAVHGEDGYEEKTVTVKLGESTDQTEDADEDAEEQTDSEDSEDADEKEITEEDIYNYFFGKGNDGESSPDIRDFFQQFQN